MAVSNVSGLASGIQWNDIIDAFIKADRASTAVLEKRKETFQGRLDAVRSLNTKMLSLQLDVSSLNRTSAFQVRQATVSNATAATATASSKAIAGTTTIDVVSTAKAHQLATPGQASDTFAYGAGTVTIGLGTGGTKTVTIDAGASSLTDIATAINAAETGVTASVVNTGSGATPYKLLLTSSKTGGDGAITVSGTGGTAGLMTQAAMSTVTAADNATVRIGSGPGAIELTQSSNTFKDLVNGVDVTVKAPATGVAIAVGTDTTGTKDRINAFVSSYNAVVDELKAKAGYDPTTKAAGVLFSESDIKRGMQRVTQSLLTAVPGLPASLSTATSVGITIDRSSGKLSIDAAMLDAKLAADPDGVMKLFTNSGTSTSSQVSFGALGDKTKVGSPFTVAVTAAAQQAVLTGAAVTAPVVITAANKDLDFAINGKTYNLDLAEGPYATAEDLAAHVQSVINQGVGTLSEQVDVGVSGGALRIASRTYGFSVTLQAKASSTALAALGLGTTMARGTDVAGTINGAAATGSGQVLSGAAGSDAEGLRLLVTATAPLAGVSVTARKGLAQTVSEAIKAMTDNTTGLFATKDKSLNESITSIGEQVKKTDERLALRRDRYTQMFLAMERSINSSNSLGNFLSGQISAFENAAAARANG
ncbi:MAG: hypothetical protein RLZZ127_1013 [Planctomycetota bacterium]|jgi:flagellar hook-associated protein 2